MVLSSNMSSLHAEEARVSMKALAKIAMTLSAVHK